VRECFVSKNVSKISHFVGCFLDHLRERLAFQRGCSDSDFCVEIAGFGSVFCLFVNKSLVLPSYTVSIAKPESMVASDL
jgi:hypothetical protein